MSSPALHHDSGEARHDPPRPSSVRDSASPQRTPTPGDVITGQESDVSLTSSDTASRCCSWRQTPGPGAALEPVTSLSIQHSESAFNTTSPCGHASGASETDVFSLVSGRPNNGSTKDQSRRSKQGR